MNTPDKMVEKMMEADVIREAARKSEVKIGNPEWLVNAEDTDNLQLAWEIIEIAKDTFLNMTRKLTDGKKKKKKAEPD